jgi:hypothetical protein
MWDAKLANDFLNFPIQKIIQKITIQKSLQRKIEANFEKKFKTRRCKSTTLLRVISFHFKTLLCISSASFHNSHIGNFYVVLERFIYTCIATCNAKLPPKRPICRPPR